MVLKREKERGRLVEKSLVKPQLAHSLTTIILLNRGSFKYQVRDRLCNVNTALCTFCFFMLVVSTKEIFGPMGWVEATVIKIAFFTTPLSNSIVKINHG